MLFKRQTANIALEGDQITVTSKDLSLRFNYSSVTSLYINNENDEVAREMEVSLKKLKRTEPELADFLRMNVSANGVSFSFVVSRAEGEPLALYVENAFRRMMLSADVVPGSVVDELKQDLLKEDPNEAVYPIYFHGCDNFGEEEPNISQEETDFISIPDYVPVNVGEDNQKLGESFDEN